MIEEIHQRLDRIFLENLSAGNDKYDIQMVEGGAKAEEQFGALSEEMATLYSEISTVAKMSLNQEYRGALQQRLHLRKHRAACESQSTMNHVREVLLECMASIRLIYLVVDQIQSRAHDAASGGPRSLCTWSSLIDGCLEQDRVLDCRAYESSD